MYSKPLVNFFPVSDHTSTAYNRDERWMTVFIPRLLHSIAIMKATKTTARFCLGSVEGDTGVICPSRSSVDSPLMIVFSWNVLHAVAIHAALGCSQKFECFYFRKKIAFLTLFYISINRSRSYVTDHKLMLRVTKRKRKCSFFSAESESKLGKTTSVRWQEADLVNCILL